MAGWTELPVVISGHAVKRARERFSASLKASDVRYDVESAIAAGRLSKRLPRGTAGITRREGMGHRRFVWTPDTKRVYVIVRRRHREAPHREFALVVTALKPLSV